MFVKIKRLLCVSAVISVMASSYVLAAPPEKPNIPQMLLNSKITGSYVQKMADRVKYFAKELLAAENEDAVVAARKSLIDDNNLYDSQNYKDVYAKVVSAVLTQVVQDGKILDISDPLRELKLTNAAIVLCGIPNREMADAYYAMIASDQEMLHFLGWKGLRDIRGTGLDKAQLQTLYGAAQKTLADDKNSNVTSMVCQAINFSTSDTGKLSDAYRKGVSKVTVETIEPAWPKFIETVNKSVSSGDISNLASPVTTLSGSVLLLDDPAAVDKAKKLVLAVLSATVDKFAKVYALQMSIDKKLKDLEKQAAAAATDPNNPGGVTFGGGAQPAQPGQPAAKVDLPLTPEQMKLKQSLSQCVAMAQACKVLMLNCEFALNSLTSQEKDFFASQFTVSTNQSDAMKLALIDWQDIVNAKKAQ